MEFITLKSIVADVAVSLNSYRTIADALEIMTKNLISSVIVVDDDAHPIGIFTEYDSLRVLSERMDKQKPLSEVMTPNPFCVEETLHIHDAYMIMQSKGYRHLVVVDTLKRFTGIVSEGDFLRHIGFEGLSKFKIVSDIMSDAPLLVATDASLIQTATLMKNRKCDYAIITDGHSHPIGLVTQRDIAQWCIDDKEKSDVIVESLMRTDFKMITKDILLQEAALQMQKHGVHQLIVVDDSQNLIGLLSRHDLLYAIHGTYFEFLIKTIDQKNSTIAKLNEQKEIERGFIQKQAELAEQKTFLHTLVNSIPDLIWLKDTKGTYLACNEMFERFFNAKESEIIGKNDFDFVDADLAQFFQEHDKAAIKASGSRINEEFLTFGDGSYKGYFETVKTPMRDSHGKVIGVLGIARDISDRKRQNGELEQIQALAHIGTWEWDIVQDLFTGSAEAYRIFGIKTDTRVSFKDVIGHFAPEDREKVTYQLFDASKSNKKLGSLYRVLDSTAGQRWIKTHTEFQYDKENNPIKAIGIFQDLTEQVEYENEILRKDKDLGSVQRLAKIGSWRINVKNNILEWSDETYRIFAKQKDAQLTYNTFLECIHPSDLEQVKNAWQAAMGGEDYEIEHRIIANGEIRWVKEHARLEVDAFGEFSSGIGMVQDITEQKLYQEKLETLANYDSLTGLANRALLMSHLQNSIEQAKRNKTQIALLMFDLDRFKDINDSYGHNSGDELLRDIASRFSMRLREGDLVSRIGGDEFAIVLENLAHPEDAGRLAQQMINTLALEYKLSAGALIHIGVSVGIALFPDNGHNASDLLQHSDAALYKSKADGRGTYSYYTDDLTKLARKRIECENDLRRAIEKNEFEVYYQPQVHIASGRILGAEALIRWNHPLRGMVSPTELIPIAEELGLISAIGEWVLNETCRQGKIWLDKGYRLTLAVNISAHQIRYQNIPQMVEKALKKSGFQPNRLELELTESALMQREEEVVEMLHLLRAKGIRLAIDDFGTGYSSLSYLKRFPIDILKIDKSFIDDIPYDTDDMAIVSAIIAMAHALGFQVLAEGTEREEQIEFLKEKGCTMYQGYFKSKPVPAAEFEKLLQV
ncbi:EAL domain-containing protein [bacterium]|nr:EAL domain-containing protein [bacterium]MBU1994228.1 EAL domain-containing protein [bacterium]